jgi:excisionase family DNA binding protein
MSTTILDIEMSLESKEEVELAKAAQRCIMSALDHSKAENIALQDEDCIERIDGAPLLKLPPKVLRLIAEMLGSLAQGKAVALMPKEMDLTTQVAAQLLNVSRPYFIRLLEQGKLPYHMVGSHRRVRLADILDYKETRTKNSQEKLQALLKQAQELNMGYSQ